MTLFPEDPDPPTDPREQAFHNMVREYVIFFLILLTLYGCSYGFISSFKRRKEDCYADEEDALVYRISLWMCTFSLATSIGAALLLPFSIVTNEVLLLYPDSYYIQWLNDSLVQGLWNYVFLFSNISLFVLLPFAYFFTESEGFSGSKKGIMSRVNETIVLLLLLAILVFGITYLLCCILGYNEMGLKNFFTLWHYLPFLYSCVSFMGVVLLLLCTPLGIATLFTVLGELVVKPQFLRNIQEEYDVAVLEEMNLKRMITLTKQRNALLSSRSQSQSLPSLAFESNQVRQEMDYYQTHDPRTSDRSLTEKRETYSGKNGTSSSLQMKAVLVDVESTRKGLEQQIRASAFRRNLGYPVAMLSLACLTVFAALLVVQNTLELLVGMKALPISSAQQFSLGITSLSKIGLLGSSLEITLILYLWVASVVGLYTLPLFCHLRPKWSDTSFTQIIGNSALLLILSSALPVLARTVGITNFDLLGEFGSIQWLGNFYVVLAYNLVFAITTALSLTNKFTRTVRRELLRRFKAILNWFFWTKPGDVNGSKTSHSNTNGSPATTSLAFHNKSE